MDSMQFGRFSGRESLAVEKEIQVSRRLHETRQGPDSSNRTGKNTI